MKSYKRIAIYILFIGIISVLFGTTYAFFNYTRTGATNTLIVGNIYMNHTQGTEITLQGEFPQKKENARERSDNTVTITVTGYNESEKDIYYKLMLNHGDEVTGRNRIDDKFLRFDLIEELPNNEERFIVFNESFETINNTILVKDRIDAGTSPSNSVSKTFKLRMWIGDDILISDTNLEADYSTSEFMNLFGSVKITAKGDTENVYYYSSFDDAITAINAESYESDTIRSLAKAGIYTDSDDNTTNLVLYDDIETDTYYEINKPVDINLYGYTINDTSTDTHYAGFAVYADSSIQNGVINARTEGENHHYLIYTENASGVLNNIELNSLSATIDNRYYGSYIYADSSGDMIIKNSNVDEVSFNSYDYSALTITNVDAVGWILADDNTNVELNDSYFYNQNTILVYIYELGTLIVNNSTIFSDSPGCYFNNTVGYYYDYYSYGIDNYGTVVINSGYVFGTCSGLAAYNGSKTYIYGGTFESTDAGGLFFRHGPSGVAYVENANIGGIDYPAEGKLRPNGKINSFVENDNTYTLEEGRVPFYMGGSSTQNGQSVYLVNCNIYAQGTEVLVLQNTTPQQNLYLSGTRFTNTRTDQYIRLQNFNTMRLYLGSGNDFGLLNKVYNNGTKVPFDTAREAGAIIDTNFDYKDAVRPE